MSFRRTTIALGCALATLAFQQTASAQKRILPSHSEPANHDSGALNNVQAAPQVIFEQIINMGTVAWSWVEFDSVNLPSGSFVRITNLVDNEQQTLNASQMVEWGNRTAMFNGASLKVELVAGANTQANRVRIANVRVSDVMLDEEPRAICGGVDNRVASTHQAVGRWVDNGGGSCTAWMFQTGSGGTDRCFNTAGHCPPGATSGVVQFNVPNSAANCAIVAPPVADQFPILFPTITSQNAGPGNDWAVFKCGLNSLAQTAFQRYGTAIQLASSGITNGTAVRHIGYGVDGGTTGTACSCANPNGVANQTRQQSDGVLSGVTTNDIQHNMDICGGDSGGVVIRVSDGLAVGNTTHDFGANCPGSSINGGTRITQANWAAAMTACAGTIAPNDQVPAMSKEGLLLMLGFMAIAGVLVIRGRQAA